MSETDRIKWDDRYRKSQGNTEPAAILPKYIHLAATGKALDIACGNGRHSRFIAERGFDVDAVDISRVATDRIEGRHPRIHVICTDLDTWTIPEASYDLIVNIRFLDRRLFPMIQKGLAPGGVLIFEAFLNDAGHRYGLASNELLREFRSLRVVYYEEVRLAQPEKFDGLACFVGVNHLL
jgi:tellurite methyltransferase